MIAILQSNYIPWKGYFDIISAVDDFAIFDEAQFTRRDWRNRNKIIIDGQSRWLTIPVASKGKFEAPIAEIQVSDSNWAEDHWRAIRGAYRRADYFRNYEALLQAAYEKAASLAFLSDINLMFLKTLAPLLNVSPNFRDTREVPRKAVTPTTRLVEICVGLGASEYLSGPAARDYIKLEEFDVANVSLHYADYSGYPIYNQGRAEFEHGVSVIDMLMRCGPEAGSLLKVPTSRASFVGDRVQKNLPA